MSLADVLKGKKKTGLQAVLAGSKTGLAALFADPQSYLGTRMAPKPTAPAKAAPAAKAPGTPKGSRKLSSGKIIGKNFRGDRSKVRKPSPLGGGGSILGG